MPAEKPALWKLVEEHRAKQAQASIPSKHKQASHESPGTEEGRSKGGRNRALKLSSEKRQSIARKAAQARWKKESHG